MSQTERKRRTGLQRDLLLLATPIALAKRIARTLNHNKIQYVLRYITPDKIHPRRMRGSFDRFRRGLLV